jgi:hypothetical protein
MTRRKKFNFPHDHPGHDRRPIPECPEVEITPPADPQTFEDDSGGQPQPPPQPPAPVGP